MTTRLIPLHDAVADTEPSSHSCPGLGLGLGLARDAIKPVEKHGDNFDTASTGTSRIGLEADHEKISHIPHSRCLETSRDP